LSDEFVINQTSDGNQWFPEIGMNHEGRFAVVWESDSTSDTRRDVRVRLFDSHLEAGNEILVNTTRAGDQSFPAVAMDAFGRFVVAWDSAMSPEHQILAQRFTANGDPSGGEFVVNTTVAHRGFSPSVAANDVGDFFVVWDIFGKDGQGQGSFGRRFDADGVPLGGEFQINTTAEDDQTFPVAAAAAENEHFVVVWNSQQQDGEGYGVFGQRFGLVSSAGSISGYVYVDVNNNGVKDPPETGLPNVPVTVFGPVTQTVLTDDDGLYQFSALPPGEYGILQTQPTAFMDGIDRQGEPASGDTGEDQFVGVQLAKRMEATVFNFGERGLRVDLAGKRFFLASTPADDQTIEQLDVAESDGWFTIDSPVFGELRITLSELVQDPVIEVYDNSMLPMVVAHDETQTVAQIQKGQTYFVYLAGSGLETSLLQIRLDRSGIYTNPVQHLDVSGDGRVSPVDALFVINELNTYGAHPASGPGNQAPFLDVSRDLQIAPHDVLFVINFLNGDLPEIAEGEASSVSQRGQFVPWLEGMLAFRPDGHQQDRVIPADIVNSLRTESALLAPEMIAHLANGPRQTQYPAADGSTDWLPDAEDLDLTEWESLLTELAQDIAESGP